jgi:hypothetical protein
LQVVESFEINPEEEEILRLLRRKKTDKDPGTWTLDLVRRAIEEAKTLSRPRGVYEFLDRGRLPVHPVFESGERVGLCICTIGPELEAGVSDLMRKGELARGVVLDAVGSEMAEATARVLDERMEAEEAREGHLASARFSPGYGGWDLEGQRLLFDILDGGRIGVELSPSMMMTPRKSVSFAVNFGPDPKPPRCALLCDQCEIEDCPYRRD